MTIQVIPTFSDPFYSQTTTLEGVAFRMSFAFNQRERCWSMSLADSSGVDIANGVKLMIGWKLLRTLRDRRRPLGDFIIWSTTKDRTPPGLFDLSPNARCMLLYVTSDVLAQLSTAAGLAAFLATLQTNTQNATASGYGVT